MNTALLIIDIQNDYFPGGKMELQGAIEACERAEQLLSVFRNKDLPVIHIQHISRRPGATFFLPGSSGAEIHVSVKPLDSEATFQKSFPNSFRNTPLLECLRTDGIGHLVIVGMMTHMCVDATTRAAFDYGFRCTVLGDACATRSLSIAGRVIPADYVQWAFLAALNGIYADVTNTGDFLCNLP